MLFAGSVVAFLFFLSPENTGLYSYRAHFAHEFLLTEWAKKWYKKENSLPFHLQSALLVEMGQVRSHCDI